MGRKQGYLAIILGIGLVAAAEAACADTDLDIRLKLGSAAPVKTVAMTGLGQGASDSSSSNFQAELAITPRQGATVNFVGTVGLFIRHHVGLVAQPLPTEVDYDAQGISGSAGVSVRANERVHFESRLELAMGSGKPDLRTHGIDWKPTREDQYQATSIIVGGYLTVSKQAPAFQIGLELGAQSYSGDFSILNDAGSWTKGKVKGSGSTVSLVAGFSF